MIIFGEPTQSFAQADDTINVNSNIKNWDSVLTSSLQILKESNLKSTGYKKMVDDFCEVFSVAEDMFNEEEITKAFIEALDKQRQFYKTKENFYNNLKTTLRFKFNEK